MRFIKNKRVWKKWLKDTGLNFQDAVLEPCQYPCFAYTTVQSWGYQELNEHYIFLSQVEEMARRLVAGK